MRDFRVSFSPQFPCLPEHLQIDLGQISLIQASEELPKILHVDSAGPFSRCPLQSHQFSSEPVSALHPFTLTSASKTATPGSVSRKTSSRARAFLRLPMLLRSPSSDGLKKIRKEDEKGSGQSNSPHARCRIKEPKQEEGKNTAEDRTNDENPHVMHKLFSFRIRPPCRDR